MKRKQNIIPQMFDVRPVNDSGDLDLEKIKKLRRVVKVKKKENPILPVESQMPLVCDVREPDLSHQEARRFERFINQEKELYRPRETRVNVFPAEANDFTEIPVEIERKRNNQNIVPVIPDIYLSPAELRIEKNGLEENSNEEEELHFPYQNIYEENNLEKDQFYDSQEITPEAQYANKFLERYAAQEKDYSESNRKLESDDSWYGVDWENSLVTVGNQEKNNLEEEYALPDYNVVPKKIAPRKRKSNARFGLFKNLKSNLFGKQRLIFSYAGAAFIIFLIVAGVSLVGKGIRVKNLALTGSEQALASLYQAKDNMSKRDFQAASFNFSDAYNRFDEISQDVNSLGSILVDTTKYVPYLSKVSSGKNLVEAGKNISQAGVLITQTADNLNKIKNPLDKNQSVSYLEVFQETDKNLKEISSLLKETQQNLDSVNLDDIPADKRAKFLELKDKLPSINALLDEFMSDETIFIDILGGNGPRKYLFLFQNNQEMRATGGFIGSYALLDIFNGRVRNFFVDGIFNPDGQLKERVVPPGPIQKISANWSLHDSNWFPDFPKSAEKAMWFYEKTGGPTVDGVITMTPEVLGRMLEVTGPIDMPEYGVTVDKDNFLESIQYEVEDDYDKQLNQPKKILADLAPKVLDKIFNSKDVSDIAKTMNILLESLHEKHILIYARNWDVEKRLSERGWTGEVLSTDKDYLSVINTNINGFKTDGVIDETINQKSEIHSDGSIINTVTIRRHHNGGTTAHEWWNKVNADYMRVYVPKGCQLISVSGQVREFDKPPLDYKALGYKEDPQVKMEEDSMTIDDQSGTRVYEDSGKTVFANWIYVSPQETAEITYSYLLPFKIDLESKDKVVDTYSLLAQKQSGSLDSKFISQVVYPSDYNVLWKYPDENVEDVSDLPDGQKGFRINTDLAADKFIGVAFSKE